MLRHTSHPTTAVQLAPLLLVFNFDVEDCEETRRQGDRRTKRRVQNGGGITVRVAIVDTGRDIAPRPHLSVLVTRLCVRISMDEGVPCRMTPQSLARSGSVTVVAL